MQTQPADLALHDIPTDLLRQSVSSASALATRMGQTYGYDSVWAKDARKAADRIGAELVRRGEVAQ